MTARSLPSACPEADTSPDPVRLRVALLGSKPQAVQQLRAELTHALERLAGCTVTSLSEPSEGEPSEDTLPTATCSLLPPRPNGPPPRVHWQLCNASAWLLAPHGAAKPPAADAVLLLSEPCTATVRPPAAEVALRQALHVVSQQVVHPR